MRKHVTFFVPIAKQNAFAFFRRIEFSESLLAFYGVRVRKAEKMPEVTPLAQAMLANIFFVGKAGSHALYPLRAITLILAFPHFTEFDSAFGKGFLDKLYAFAFIVNRSFFRLDAIP